MVFMLGAGSRPPRLTAASNSSIGVQALLYRNDRTRDSEQTHTARRTRPRAQPDTSPIFLAVSFSANRPRIRRAVYIATTTTTHRQLV